MTYFKGDTIRLKATFYDFAGSLADLSATPSLKVYDDHEVLLVTALPASIIHPSTGVYYYDYTLTQTGKLTFEFAGTLETNAVLARQSFTSVFV
jgi:hypothetical protein